MRSTACCRRYAGSPWDRPFLFFFFFFFYLLFAIQQHSCAQLKPNGNLDGVFVDYTKEVEPHVLSELGDLTVRQRLEDMVVTVVRQDHEPMFESHASWMDATLSGAPVHYLKNRSGPLQMETDTLPDFAKENFNLDPEDPMLQIRYEVEDTSLPPSSRRLAEKQSIVVAMYMVLVHNQRLLAKLPDPPKMPSQELRTGATMLVFATRLRLWKGQHGRDLLKVVITECDGQAGDAPSWIKGSATLGTEQRRHPMMGDGQDTVWGFFAGRCVPRTRLS